MASRKAWQSSCQHSAQKNFRKAQLNNPAQRGRDFFGAKLTRPLGGAGVLLA